MKRYQIDEKDVAAPGGDHVEIRHGTHWSPVDVSCKFLNEFNQSTYFKKYDLVRMKKSVNKVFTKWSFGEFFLEV